MKTLEAKLARLHANPGTENAFILADGDLDATEACRFYHAELRTLGVTRHRSLEEDLQLTDERMAPR